MPDKNIKTNNQLNTLLNIMAQLRHSETGCPWDLEQNFESIAPYTIEEAYEVADAIQQKDMGALRDELGDLLFQVVFHSRMAEEQGAFDFDDVAQSICDKLTRRHPHVFEGEKIAKEDLATHWERQKRDELTLSASSSILDGISANQPAMNQAYKLQKKASSVGFDWGEIGPVIDKLDEEIAEIKHEINIKDNRQRIEDEMGDVLFSCINLARHLEINPEWSLRRANERFYKRFSHIEQQLEMVGKSIEDCSLAELDDLWNEAKRDAS